ncbi:hypothetical protein FDP41_004710 [Naegleria fowleri]|uniref:Uncharacterized protein n=1 Tax=Naegleria fowleri TaxID=5763 RepID=A0A6A5BPL0_NAEFO|nr:uncharacterized protein FDP41_005656 [Naegleria fowleri]XP_044560747.1 uncharacterized protein FDP41_004710 [Naegleria fowleri]KAF0975325.1 hypothetical protein FDP41_005656 [Naegleria fowleri]KAF0976034.1 hypothetical protein FDP41_004710 [Naegleria fowleri]
MKRKQKILFFLTGLLVALCFRVVYHGTSAYMNEKDWMNFPNLLDYRIVLWVFSVIENALSFGAIVTITMIIGFLQDLFMTTAAAAGTMTKKVYIFTRGSIIALNMITSGILCVLIILNAILNLLVKITLLNKTLAVPLQIVLLCIFFIVNVTNLIVFIAVSARLLFIVKKTSSNVSSDTTKEKVSFMNRPFTKICGLMLGMILSAFIQIIAAIISFLTSTFAGYLHILDKKHTN